MKRSDHKFRRPLLWLTLLATLLVSSHITKLKPAPPEKEAGKNPAGHHLAETSLAETSPGIERPPQRKMEMRPLAAPSRDIFSDTPLSPGQGNYLVPPLIVLPEKTPPEITSETVQSPAAPQPPPLPFIYLGRLGEAGRYKVFIAAYGKNHAVSAGDLVIQHYRIERIDPPTMTVTYLPMNLTQTLPIGEPD
jgi:hypothetical protein